MGTAGQIKLVHAEDFMNHKHFEVEFGCVLPTPLFALHEPCHRAMHASCMHPTSYGRL